MATGDLRNNIDRLFTLLSSIKCEHIPDHESISSGDPKCFLPIIHYTLLRYSRLVSEWISEQGFDLLGKSDSRFMEGTFRLLRTHFNYNPSLTINQFFSSGFAERKLILMHDLIRLCKTKHAELTKQNEPKKTFTGLNSRLQPKTKTGDLEIEIGKIPTKTNPLALLRSKRPEMVLEIQKNPVAEAKPPKSILVKTSKRITDEPKFVENSNINYEYGDYYQEDDKENIHVDSNIITVPAVAQILKGSAKQLWTTNNNNESSNHVLNVEQQQSPISQQHYSQINPIKNEEQNHQSNEPVIDTISQPYENPQEFIRKRKSIMPTVRFAEESQSNNYSLPIAQLSTIQQVMESVQQQQYQQQQRSIAVQESSTNYQLPSVPLQPSAPIVHSNKPPSYSNGDVATIQKMMSTLIDRFSDLESKFDTSLQTMNKKLTSMEGKIRWFEEQQNQQKIQDTTPSSQVYHTSNSSDNFPEPKNVVNHEREDFSSSTFLTSVPETIFTTGTPETLSAQEKIAAIAKSFRQTQELINNRRPIHSFAMY